MPAAPRLTWPQRVALAMYSLALWLARPLLRRKLARRARTEPGYAHAVAERLGRYCAPLPPAWLQPTAPRVWVHAVSLGETRAAAILLAALRPRCPGMRLLLTHSTATGWAEGQRLLQPGDTQTWLPWDEPAVVGRFVQRFQPQVGVLMETEVWPNLVRACAQQGVPLVLANARLNARSCQQAQRLAWLSGPAYAGLAAVWAQTEADAQRLRSLAAPVQGVWGNLKFDAQPDAAQCQQGQSWRQALQRPVVMLASSRDGEEFEFLEQIRALALLNKKQSAIYSDDSGGAVFSAMEVLWLIVPRHPQRFDAVAALVQAQGWPCVRRSAWAGTEADAAGVVAGVDASSTEQPPVPTVLLGDSLGEMALYYSLADVALLGGSFAPLGGQNLIEALACACPVVVGPHTFNFAEVAEQAVAAGAACRVASMAEGVASAWRWLPEGTRNAPLAAAADLLAKGRGGAARTAEAVAALVREAVSAA